MKKKVIYSLGLAMLVGGLIGEAQAAWDDAILRKSMEARKAGKAVNRVPPSMRNARQSTEVNSSNIIGFVPGSSVFPGNTNAGASGAGGKLDEAKEVEELKLRVNLLTAANKKADKRVADLQSAVTAEQKAKEDSDKMLANIKSLMRGVEGKQDFVISALGKDINLLTVDNSLCNAGGAAADFAGLAGAGLKDVFGDKALPMIQRMYQEFINNARECEEIAKTAVYCARIWGANVLEDAANVRECKQGSLLETVKTAEAVAFDAAAARTAREAVVNELFDVMKRYGLQEKLDLSEDSWNAFQGHFRAYVTVDVLQHGIDTHPSMAVVAAGAAPGAGGAIQAQDAAGVIRGEMGAILDMLQRYIRQDCLELSYCKMLEKMLPAIDEYVFAHQEDRDYLKYSLLQLVRSGTGIMAGGANIATGAFGVNAVAFAGLNKGDFDAFADRGNADSGNYLPAENTTIGVDNETALLASETKRKVVEQFISYGNGLR